jgi:hypothetical protein
MTAVEQVGDPEEKKKRASRRQVGDLRRIGEAEP